MRCAGWIVLFFLGFVNLEVNAQQGASCTTPNGERATCKSIYDCNVLLQAIQTRNSVQLRFLRDSQCGYESSPLVCCGRLNNYASAVTEPYVVTGQRTIGTNSPQFRSNPAIPTRSSCGFQETDKIFDGETTALDEFPWMALLQYSNSSGYRRYSCGGSLISPRYVLTAAHCVTGDILRKVGRLVAVRLGEWSTDTVVDCSQPGICNQAPVDVGVEEIKFHDGYDSNNMQRYNDIALVRLNRRVTYSNYIRAICLPLPSEASSLGTKLIVAGWGKTEKLNRSPVKLKVEIPIAQRVECTNVFSTAGIRLRDSQICAGGEAGRDSCTGDSGGPLMMTAKNDSSQWYIEGVVSFGAQCGTEGWPGIYTKVSTYLQWIHNSVRN